MQRGRRKHGHFILLWVQTTSRARYAILSSLEDSSSQLLIKPSIPILLNRSVPTPETCTKPLSESPKSNTRPFRLPFPRREDGFQRLTSLGYRWRYIRQNVYHSPRQPNCNLWILRVLNTTTRKLISNLGATTTSLKQLMATAHNVTIQCAKMMPIMKMRTYNMALTKILVDTFPCEPRRHRVALTSGLITFLIYHIWSPHLRPIPK